MVHFQADYTHGPRLKNHTFLNKEKQIKHHHFWAMFLIQSFFGTARVKAETAEFSNKEKRIFKLFLGYVFLQQIL